MEFLGFYDYTVVLTYVSLVVSVYGITNAIEGHFRIAILCLAVSGLCDMFDGRIARTKKDRTKDEARFGIQIDSLCDVVCFGINPVVICYCMGVQKPIGILVLSLYSVASVIRLGFFNVMEEKRQEEEGGSREYYQGLPITSIAVILPLVYFGRFIAGAHFVFVLYVTLTICAILMITNFRIKKPKNPVAILIAAVVGLVLAKIFKLI